MATSGTTTFDLSLVESAEEAWERAGSEVRSGYDLRTTRRSINLLMADWANRGVNLWTVASDSITLVPGTATYAVPDAAVDLIEQVIRTGAGSATTQADLTCYRISVSTYASIPNKLSPGRPLQVLVTRGQAGNSITLWPVPDSATPYVFTFWYLRRMSDAPLSGNQTNDLPYRFLNAFVAGLAYFIALKIPEGQSRLVTLKQMYDDAWDLASTEDREKASVRFVPRIGAL
jgi:hypothetical protein